jgi:metallo-beta-lactamase family protein
MTISPVLRFLGGAGTVTGSKYLLEHGGTRVLVDAGLFQGVRSLRRRNWAPLGLPADSLDAVVISHAHLDHVGYLPALVRQGFAGPVYATASTAALAEIVLRDSAKIQEYDAAYARSHGFSKHADPQPLYRQSDVARALPLFQRLEYGTTAQIAPDIALTMRPAGHILGSASPLLAVAGYPVQFSGDLGRPEHPLLPPPDPPAAAAAIVLESTYGDRRHADDVLEPLASAVRRTIGRGGTVVIPAFAVDRTEVVLMALHQLRQAGAIPDVPIHLDSPMGLQALRVYTAAIERGEYRAGAATAALHDPALRFAATTEESIRLNQPSEPCIIISSSGMATGGRVLHHLRALLPDRANSVLLVGYQAPATRGRDLLEGARQIKIHGLYVPVRAEIVDLSGFSVHADADELIGWLSQCPQEPDVVYLVHGEPASSEALAERIAQELAWTAVVARDGELVRLRAASPRAPAGPGTAAAPVGAAAAPRSP